MNSINDFHHKQKVTIWDEDDKRTITGIVTEVNAEQETVSILWEDMNEDCLHNASEFNNIKPA